MEVNSVVGRADGISGEDLAALGAWAGHPAFTQREQAALAYAEAMTTSNSVARELFARVQEHFSDDEIVELTAVISFEICAAKFNRALEIESQGLCLISGEAGI
jgi:alkylhydroperoxidase family enzyme